MLSAVKFEGEHCTASGVYVIYFGWPCILTNNHVIKDKGTALSGKIEFKDQKEVQLILELDPSIYFLTD
jgi:hypothetical protein